MAAVEETIVIEIMMRIILTMTEIETEEFPSW
jgi:hypothetical protein